MFKGLSFPAMRSA